MPTGVVKWFNESKGFGFVTPDEGGNDIFAHFSDITGAGFRTLRESQRIEYELKNGPKGPQAANIRSLEPEPSSAPVRKEFSERPPRGYGERPPTQSTERPARPATDRSTHTAWGAPVRDPGSVGGGLDPNFAERKAPPRRFNERPKRDHKRSNMDDE
jgi:CspA family cold shock protein